MKVMARLLQIATASPPVAIDHWTHASGQRQRVTGEWVLYGVGLLATVAVTIFVTPLARNALAKKIGSNETVRNLERKL